MYETMIKSIGFNKKTETFTITGYTKGVDGNKIKTFKLLENEEDNKNLSLEDKIHEILSCIFHEKYKILPSANSYFLRCFAYALWINAMNQNISVYEFYNKLKRVIEYGSIFDPEELRPSKGDVEKYMEFIQAIATFLKNDIEETYGIIRVDKPESDECKEVYLIYRDIYTTAPVDNGQEFSLTKATFSVILYDPSLYFIP